MRTAFISIVVSLLTAVACTSDQGDALQEPSSFEVTPYTKRTTQSEIAIANLGALIVSQERRLELRPRDLSVREALIDGLLTRVQFLGTTEDFDRALLVAEDVVRMHPEEARAYALRARVYQSLHFFAEADHDLRRVEALGGERRADVETTVMLARGVRLDEVLAQRAAHAARFPSYESLVDLAGAQAALGHFEDADGAYLAALEAYNDVSPFPVAFVYFQRGVMWAEMADRPERGLALYREAVRLLPQYVVANVHLAELEWEVGEASQAAARLESVRAFTGDPEPTGLLAEIIADAEPARAEALIDEASAAYDALFKNHPLAYLDHGSEFFAGPGADADRAVELALHNLGLRPGSDRAYKVAIEAALAADWTALACDLAEDAGDERASVPLNLLTAELAQRCR